MAATRKQTGMVLHQEALPAPGHPGVLPRPCRSPPGEPPALYPQEEPLPSVQTSRGVRVTLDNNGMWSEFHRCGTEMMVTRQGSRMFPYCRFRITGLQPSRSYTLLLDLQPLDGLRYAWTAEGWRPTGEADAEARVPGPPFTHPESPAAGHHWMKTPVSFYKLRLTDGPSDLEGTAALLPMHRYLPRLHLVRSDQAAQDRDQVALTFTFAQTQFMAVTAYQSARFARLKVDYNPFAKGLRDDPPGVRLRSKDLQKGDEGGSPQQPLRKSLKFLLANHKPRGSKAVDSTPTVPENLAAKRSSADLEELPPAVPEGERASHPAQKLFSELIREAHVPLQRCKLLDDRSPEPWNQPTRTQNSATCRAQSETPVDRVKEQRSDGKAELCPEGSGAAAASAGSQKSQNSQKSQIPLKSQNSQNSQNFKEPQNSQNSQKSSNSHKSQILLKSQNSQNSQIPLKSRNSQDPQNSPNSQNSQIPLKSQNSQNSQDPQKSQNSQNSQIPLKSQNSQNPQDPQNSQNSQNSQIPLKSQNSQNPQNSQNSQDLQNSCSPERPRQRQQPGPLPALALFLKQHSARPRRTKTQKLDPPSGPPPLSSDPPPPDAASEPTPQCPTPDPGPAEPPGPASEGAVLVRPRTDSSGPGPLDLETTLPPSSSAAATSVSPTSQSLPPAAAVAQPSFSPLLPGPQSPSFGFEPFSPPSSPEPLASFALPLDPAPKAPPPKETGTAGTSGGGCCSPAAPPTSTPSFSPSSSVFQWHTVLPPAEPYLQDLAPPPAAPAQTLQDPDQPLGFPGDLSPLALPLSPTFSSLDGDVLSPTPSLTDLVTFFSNSEDLEMGIEFPTAVPAAAPPPGTPEDDTDVSRHMLPPPPSPPPPPPPPLHSSPPSPPPQRLPPSPPPPPPPARKHYTAKKKKRKRTTKIARTDQDCSYTSRHPNLEEVEEQLFISFTSKEALQLHLVDTQEKAEPQPQETLEAHLPEPSNSPEEGESMAGVVGVSPNGDAHHGLSSSSSCQELGRSLQDHLTSSPPEQQDQGEMAKTPEEKICALEKVLLRDLKLMRHRQVIHPVLQEVGLKLNLLDPTLAIDLRYLGVRLPIPPPGEAPPLGACAAFVSRTGKTTDVTQIKGWRGKFTAPEAPPALAPPNTEAAAPAPAPALAPDTTKRNLSAFCSDMLDEYLENEGKLLEQRSACSFSQPAVEPVAYQLPTSSCSYVRTLDSVLQLKPQQQPPATAAASRLMSAFVPPSKRPKVTAKETKVAAKRRAPRHARTPDQDLDQDQYLDLEQEQLSAFRRRRRRRRRLKAPPPSDAPDHMAPLESDSELLEQGGGAAGPAGPGGSGGSGGGSGGGVVVEPGMTRALLKQQDLEDGVVWEGQPRISITEQRASVALTSLFTLTGFERENPTAPIRLQLLPAPRCLNPCCRLGCMCSSLTYRARSAHCGRPACMLGCSCLKQKVVLLKNLEPASDSSPSHHGHGRKRRRRRRRMRMAYILKEADSVSQPAQQVQTLWKRRNGEDSDPEPVYTPQPAAALLPPTLPPLPPHRVKRKVRTSCARVRGYSGTRKTVDQQQQQGKKTEEKKPQQKLLRVKKVKRRPAAAAPAGGAVGPPEARDPAPGGEDPPPRPSKRLTVLTQCVWRDEAERSRVLKVLCQRMALNRLDRPFWVGRHLIRPAGRYVEGEVGSADCCVHYKIHVSAPERRSPAGPPPTSASLRQVNEAGKLAEPVEDWQREVEEEEEAEPMKGAKEGEGRGHQVHDGKSGSGQKVRLKQRKVGVATVGVTLPFLQGVSPAGFLSASRRQPGGSDHVIQVNGKPYPLAKIQLGRVGALHPANRLAAYLTGRVQSTRAAAPPGGTKSAVPASSAAAAPPKPPPPTVSPLGGAVVPAITLPLQGPQLLMLPIPPAPPAPSAGQKLPALQYLRRPDGRLFQLVPVSQLTPVQLRAPPTGPAPVLPRTAAASQPPASATTLEVVLPSPPGKRPISLQSGQAPPQPLVKVLVSPAPLPLPHPTPTGRGHESGQVVDAPLSPKPITAPPLPKAPPTTTTSRPTPELAVKLSDLDLICVLDDPAGGKAGGGAKAAPQVVNLLSDEETDEENANQGEEQWQRHAHSQKERSRRQELDLLFQNLSQQVAPSESCSKVATLHKAVQVIRDLTATDANLSGTVARLMEERERLLNRLVPPTTTTGKGDGGAVNLQDELDGSSGGGEKERVIDVSSQVAVSKQSTNHSTRLELSSLIDCVRVCVFEQGELHSQHCRTSNTSDLSSALGLLAQVMDDRCSPPELLLEKVRQEIGTLQRESQRLRSIKICLKQRRDAAVRTISQHCGKSERSILHKLQLLSSRVGSLAAGGGASAGDGASDLAAQHQEPGRSPEAPPIPAVAPPICPPVQQQQQQQQQRSPATSQHAPAAVLNRSRTVPNILSRSRKQAPPPIAFADLVQVMAPLPPLPPLPLGQQMVTLRLPGAASPAGLTLIPSPLAIGGLTGQNVLQLVQPLAPVPQPPQEAAAAAAAAAAAQPAPSPPPPPDSSAGPERAPSPPRSPPLGPSSPAAAGAAGDRETLTSLLDEIAFLSQGGGAHDHSPWLLQLDSDSDDPPAAAGVEEEGMAGLRTTPPRSANGCCSDVGGALAPPPLLQRRVGGAAAVATAAATLTSRPMPRLVPLGLRGAPST